MTEGLATVKNEAMAGIERFVTVLLEVLLPIAMFFIGLAILAPAIGLSGFYGGLLGKAGLPAQAQTLLQSGAAILTYLGIGGGLIGVERMYDGWVGDVIGSFGWLSMGAGLREVIALVTGNGALPANTFLSGLGEKLSSGLQTATNGMN